MPNTFEKYIFDAVEEHSSVYMDVRGTPTQVMKMALTVTWYFTGLDIPGKRKAVLRVFEEYSQIFEGKIKWGTHPGTGKWKKLKHLRSTIHPEEWLLDFHEKGDLYFEYCGEDDLHTVSDIRFASSLEPFGEIDGGRIFLKHLSVVHCSFPLSMLQKGPEYFLPLFKHWAGILKPYHGHAGFSFERSAFFIADADVDYLETGLLFSLPGLDFYSLGESQWFNDNGLYQGPRCADWLVFLSDHWIEKLGGQEKVEKSMSPLPVTFYESGAILQARDLPELGNADTVEELTGYIHLAKVIEPIRVKRLAPRIRLPHEDRPDYDAIEQRYMDAWCARFTRPDEYRALFVEEKK